MSEGSDTIERIIPIEPDTNTTPSKDSSPEPNPSLEEKLSLERISNLRKENGYANAAVCDKLERQTRENTFQGLTVANFTDIDGTFIFEYRPTSEEASLTNEELKLLIRTKNLEYMSATQELTKLLDRYNVPLIAVTGRDFNTVHSDNRLPKFDLIVGAVGTEIWIKQKDSTYKLDPEYDAHLDKEIGFDRDKIYNAATEIIKNNPSLLPDTNLIFQDRDSLENVAAYQTDSQAKEHGLTPYDSPQKYKISFSFEGINSDKEGLEKTMREKLDQLGCNQVKTVFSYAKSGVEGKTVWNIDLVPETKKGAINYLVNKFGSLGIFGGDTGNDSDAIIGAGHAGFAVGNRKSEVDASISKASEISTTTTKQTENFRIFENPDGTKRLLFIDSNRERHGPKSQIRALRTMKLFLALMQPTTINEIKKAIGNGKV